MESDFWVVTTYFNPAGFASRRRNYQRFRAQLGPVPCLTVECAQDDRPFELAASADVVQVRASGALWQKERLVNLGVARLPSQCRFVAWVDGDVLFARPDWPTLARAELAHKLAVQLFSEVELLPSERGAQRGLVPQRLWGFAAKISAEPESLHAGRFDAHGHTGYAWAMRRDLLATVGLYDACIVGSADHVMAHALLHCPWSPCVTRLLGTATPHHQHFVAWAERLLALARQEKLVGVGFVPGLLSHLWHGAIADRRYFERNQRLAALGFDPAQDLVSDPGEPLRLRHPSSGLGTFLREYFASRNEDQDES